MLTHHLGPSLPRPVRRHDGVGGPVDGVLGQPIPGAEVAGDKPVPLLVGRGDDDAGDPAVGVDGEEGVGVGAWQGGEAGGRGKGGGGGQADQKLLRCWAEEDLRWYKNIFGSM